jgi:hypothetical protein
VKSLPELSFGLGFMDKDKNSIKIRLQPEAFEIVREQAAARGIGAPELLRLALVHSGLFAGTALERATPADIGRSGASPFRIKNPSRHGDASRLNRESRRAAFGGRRNRRIAAEAGYGCTPAAFVRSVALQCPARVGRTIKARTYFFNHRSL